MTALFFTALAVVLYTYIGYPCLIASLARLRPSSWQQADAALSASVILPVHNGMQLLPHKLQSLLSMDARLVREVIVIVDGGDDGADEFLSTQTDPRLRAIALRQQEGKSAALRRGMAAATSDLLLFVDVRPTITEDSIRKLFRNFADPSVGCVAGELHVHAGANGAAASVGGLYWKYEQWIRNCESAYSSPVGVYGGFYAIRRSLAVLPPAGLILDDMYQPLWVIRQGYRSVVDTTAVVEDRWPATSAGEFSRKVRTLAGNFQLCAMAPWILTPRNPVLLQLVSHKLLRLLVPYCMAAMLLSSCMLAAGSTAWAAVALAQLLILLTAALGRYIPVPVIRKASSAVGALLLLNAAAVCALWKYVATRGELWKIWRPTAAPAPDAPLS